MPGRAPIFAIPAFSDHVGWSGNLGFPGTPHIPNVGDHQDRKNIAEYRSVGYKST